MLGFYFPSCFTYNNIYLFPQPIATIGWICAIAVALSVVYGLRGDISGDHPSSVLTAALYNALARSAWGICVAWVIVACVTGWGGRASLYFACTGRRSEHIVMECVKS